VKLPLFFSHLSGGQGRKMKHKLLPVTNSNFVRGIKSKVETEMKLKDGTEGKIYGESGMG